MSIFEKEAQIVSQCNRIYLQHYPINTVMTADSMANTNLEKFSPFQPTENTS